MRVFLQKVLYLRADFEQTRAEGIELVTCDESRRGSGRRVIDDFRRRLGDDEVYLSFDIDCIDPAYAPGTGTPVCGGFTSSEAFGLLRQFAGVNLIGADVVEVLPDRDPTGITSLLASHVLFEILCLAAVYEKSRTG